MEQKLDELIKGVNEMKRLMMFALLRNGATQSELAKAMGIGQASISRLFSEGRPSSSKKGKR